MSNYTENFTSTAGDTVDASELETEFDAISTAIATKLDSDGSGTMTGALNMGSNLISSVTDPSSAQDAATKAYVDARHSIETVIATTSGTTATFSSLPATANHIVMTFSGVSVSDGVTFMDIQLGESATIDTTGYTNWVVNFAQTAPNVASVDGFLLHGSSSAIAAYYGQAHLVKMSAAHKWHCTTNLIVNTDAGSTLGGWLQSGVVTLASALTDVQLTCVGGGTFDAGSVGLMVHS